MDTKVDILQQALRYWKPKGVANLNPQLMELLHSGFFKHYQQFTEQMFMILDHSTIKYLYISDNFESITGYPLKAVYQGGVAYLNNNYHPEDIESFGIISERITSCLQNLKADEIKDCRLSFDYRFRYYDKTYHRLLQHNIPLTVDEHKNIVHALIMVSNIEMYKRDNHCYYKVVLYKEAYSSITLLEGTIGKKLLQPITAREKEIIELTSHGLTEAAISKKLGIGIQTVKTHRKNLFRKTGTKNAMELVRFAMANLVI